MTGWIDTDGGLIRSRHSKQGKGVEYLPLPQGKVSYASDLNSFYVFNLSKTC